MCESRNTRAPLLAAFTPAANASGPPAHAHSNALLAELAMRAVGYGAWLQQPDWPSSQQPGWEGRSWAQLRQGDACTLQAP